MAYLQASLDIMHSDTFCPATSFGNYEAHMKEAHELDEQMKSTLAEQCDMKPRCLKCNGPHQTNQCVIKHKIENPRCINCGETGHIAAYRGCKKFPKLNTPQQNRRTFNSNQSLIKNNVSFAELLRKNQAPNATTSNEGQEMAPLARPPPPTRFGDNSASIIDLAIAKTFLFPYKIHSLPELSSDHNPVLLNFFLNYSIPNYPGKLNTNWKNLKKAL
ncbi:hypothetical protein AVEN_187786-1 [Araneus ventricosus]|uniref:Pre-C2HC domain-containing protein n=1 Tax=Araneus ventricosus TaxID=182803 RepID=A0A4Y2FV77_ARAVE|nr:hypothetical protein AVEN_187786-1 [Araneus ventricosus]